MKTKILPPRQLETMEVLWGSSKAMTATEIVNVSDMAINTVQASLRSLTAKGYIRQDDVVYSGTVLARSYVPAVSREEYLKLCCGELMEAGNENEVMCSLLGGINSMDALEELEKLILRRKAELEGEVDAIP